MNYRRLRMIRCALGALVLAALLCLALAVEPVQEQAGGAVSFSRDSGFYTEAFDLELEGAGGTIYYTLDSTVPDENSTPYTGPIRISDASDSPNVYSMIPDMCLEYGGTLPEDLGRSMSYGYRLPVEPVDKITVVRAVLIDGNGVRSGIETRVYFVGFDRKEGYEGFHILSVVTDPGNLFDYGRGIYVTGRTYDEALAQGQARAENYTLLPANYRQRGIEWEREASLCLFDPDREAVLSGDFGIRIQGGASRASMPKSLNIFARKRYGTTAIPTESLYGRDWRLESLNLNSGAQGMLTKIHDCLVNDLASDLNMLTREYAPCQLFLDGEYWGVYWLTPRFKADYFWEKYGVLERDVIVQKATSIEIGVNADHELYDSMVDFIADNDMADPQNYARACELIDIRSCVDYYAVEIYIANTDWPLRNTSLWRARNPSGGANTDGKWRWIIYDVNIAMGIESAESDCLKRAVEQDALFASLMDNPDFARAVREKLAALATENFDPERVGAYIDDYERDMADAMEREYRRFYGGEKTRQDFLDACEKIRAFFERRSAYILSVYGDDNEQKGV